MVKPDPSRLSLVAWGIICLLAVILTLAACGGATTPAAEESAPEVAATEAQVATEPAEEAEAVAQASPVTEEAEPAEAATPEEEAAVEQEEAPAEEQAPEVTASGPATCEP